MIGNIGIEADMQILVGTKVFDLEERRWRIIWKVTQNPRGHRYQIRWCDGSVTRGLHDAVIDYIESGYVVLE